MPVVEMFGWREGFLKITCTRLLQEHPGLGLAQAKASTDRVLEGERVTIAIERLEVATQLAEQLSMIGAHVRVLDREDDV